MVEERKARLSAHIDGFDLHAALRVVADHAAGREQLEKLLRYCAPATRHGAHTDWLHLAAARARNLQSLGGSGAARSARIHVQSAWYAHSDAARPARETPRAR